MRLSQSVLRFAVVLGAFVAAGCDHAPESVTSPLQAPSSPNALIVPTGYSDVSVGANFACAVRAVDGGLVCWGDSDYKKTTPPTVGRYRQVSAGAQHACALRTDYVVICWGNHDWGESSPPAITFSQVSAGNKYSCGVRMDNRLLSCWGTNSTALRNTPASVAFTQVSTGDVHTCGVTYPDGKVLCWGSNDDGETNVQQDTYAPVDVGADYTCALGKGGAAVCWGSNRYGQGGIHTGTYTQVSAAYTHTCALRASDRGIVCWGQDRVGMLNAPAGAYTKVSAGDSNACAIRASDLAVVCWGNNSYGMSTPPGISTAHALPSASFSSSASVTALDTIFLNLLGARVVGFPDAKKFTYQFDCGDGKGYAAAAKETFAKCPTRVAGTRTVRGKVIDQDGDTASYALTVPVKLRTQTVSFTSTAPTNPVMNAATYTATAKSTSGLPVTIASTSSRTICASSGNVVTFVNIGTCTIAADQAGDSTYAAAPRATQSAKVIWPFTGFLNPVRNAPYVNVVTAGRYVQLPFSLGADRQVNVVPSNPIMTQASTCDGAPRNNVPSAGAGFAGVAWDTATGRYVYTWKTDATWAGTCRTLTLTLTDGTTHTLKFVFN